MAGTVKTLEQKRARQAWEDVQRIKGQSFEGEYKGLVKSTPTLILTNGLTQTLAFFASKDKAGKPHGPLAKQIADWVCSQLELDSFNLGAELREGGSELLRLATVESLAYLQWLRRFVEAEITKEEPQL